MQNTGTPCGSKNENKKGHTHFGLVALKGGKKRGKGHLTQATQKKK